MTKQERDTLRITLSVPGVAFSGAAMLILLNALDAKDELIAELIELAEKCYRAFEDEGATITQHSTDELSALKARAAQ
jgi:hypothetical protein